MKTRVEKAAREAAQQAEHVAQEGLQHVGRAKALLLNMWGPAQGTGNPLKGTDKDPAILDKLERDKRHQRVMAAEERRLHRLGLLPPGVHVEDADRTETHE